jgi:hypothetical protein
VSHVNLSGAPVWTQWLLHLAPRLECPLRKPLYRSSGSPWGTRQLSGTRAATCRDRHFYFNVLCLSCAGSDSQHDVHRRLRIVLFLSRRLAVPTVSSTIPKYLSTPRFQTQVRDTPTSKTHRPNPRGWDDSRAACSPTHADARVSCANGSSRGLW